MTSEEARALAIQMGAIEPQSSGERISAGVLAHRGGSFSDTPAAQNRLNAWTQEILNGRDPRTGGLAADSLGSSGPDSVVFASGKLPPSPRTRCRYFTVTISFILGWIPHRTLKVPGNEKMTFVLVPGS